MHVTVTRTWVIGSSKARWAIAELTPCPLRSVLARSYIPYLERSDTDMRLDMAKLYHKLMPIISEWQFRVANVGSEQAFRQM